jgi:short subunit dehydrogenase-like uncharacterized protein
VRYIAENCPTDLKWAVAGRSSEKLAEIKVIDRIPPGVIVADADDFPALESLARSTKVVISVAGPFSKYGSKLVQACAENGTHYADITGETPWIRQIIDKYHGKATPCVIIPSCGFDSIPSDLGTYLLITAMKPPVKNVRGIIEEFAGGVSGGSFASALNLAECCSLKELAETYKPFSLSPIKSNARQPRLDGNLGPWFMSGTNAAVVSRTYGLLHGIWGKSFSYREYLRYRNRFVALASLILLMIIPLFFKISAVRWLLKQFGPAAGSGPTEDVLQNGKLRMRITAESAEHTEQSASITISADKDPAYLLTAMMLVESGMVLARELDDTPVGKLEPGKTVVGTPALLGERLRDRLENGGLHFQITSEH